MTDGNDIKLLQQVVHRNKTSRQLTATSFMLIKKTFTYENRSQLLSFFAFNQVYRLNLSLLLIKVGISQMGLLGLCAITFTQFETK